MICWVDFFGMYILGISAYYHDSAAALIEDGRIIAAAQEERFTRKKHDPDFPTNAINYCLSEAGISLADLECVVFYDKPFVKFERLLETYLNFAPKGFASFIQAMPIWLKEKLFLKTLIKKEFKKIGEWRELKILFSEHHRSHAASAFYPSPFQNAAVLCLDGVGEWATTSAWLGEGNQLKPLWELKFPHSLGLLYSAFTYHAGFKVNSGEYKLMGLAPYGEPKYAQKILDSLIDLKADGTFRLNMKYFDFATGLKMTNSKFDELFGAPARKPESPVTQFEMDMARSIQAVTEEIVLRLGRTVHKETGQKYLCMAGGVALNCVANGRLHREGPFEKIWIQPAAGDAGGALGAALVAWYEHFNKSRTASGAGDSMLGSYLGPAESTDAVRKALASYNAVFEELGEDDLVERLAEILEKGSVVGWVQGRMEFGPRALGGRSILGDPRNTEMQSKMNLKIKFRESFRPFAPSVLAEDVGTYFEHSQDSPYMLMVAGVKPEFRIPLNSEQEKLFGVEKLKVPRSTLPAITHVDYSARIQSVHKETNPKFHKLISTFKKRTGCGVLINTSFNVRGEPIVCGASDSYRCFMRTDMDYLAVGNFLMQKSKQPKFADKEDWKETFQLD